MIELDNTPGKYSDQALYVTNMVIDFPSFALKF